MATYTINTTPAEDNGITHVLAKVNAERAAQVPPQAAITAQQYLVAILRRTFADYTRQKVRRDALDKLTQAERDAIGVRE